MRHFIISAAIALCTTAQAQVPGYPIDPVPFTSVSLSEGSFWGQRLDACRVTTVPLAFSKCESEGRYTNFVNAAHPSDKYKVGGFSFDDTDVYKTIEGASYLLHTFPDKRMVAYIDSVLDIVAAAQEPDGYLYTSRTQNPSYPHEWAGDRRWVKVEELSHEFYNLGHMVEGAIAHYQATGSRKFLDIACRYADCVCREIGAGEGQQCLVPGHQIAEMALAKLYVVTGEKRYLEQAKFFLDYRGKTSRKDSYSQAHKPVVEQDEAVGHAVRAGYMYTGMADVAALTGDTAYINAIDRIWQNIVGKKYYITGGVGATANGEAFGANYELPNMSAYCETCAAIAQVYLNYRLFLLHGDAKYFDCLERTLYNGVISGMSIDGGKFFYPNPLQSMGQHQRQAWFGCACCPSNICRFIPSLPGYIYAQKGNRVYVNLYNSGKASLTLKSGKVQLTQTTEYPWKGMVEINVDRAPKQMQLYLRIPGWARNQVVPSDLYQYADQVRPDWHVYVNGDEVKGELVDGGYFVIDRKWKKGDKVNIYLTMYERTVRANPLVEADRGRIAFERGPLVYCAEHPDNPDCNILNLLVSQRPQIDRCSMEMEGIKMTQIITNAQELKYDDKGKLTVKDVRLKLIPYFAWAHRGAGNMAVWLPQQLQAATPAKAPTATAGAKLTSSLGNKSLAALTDGLVPQDATDRSIPYIHWWPKKNTTEWVEMQLPKPVKLQESTVYWFDDAPWGGCRVPDSWVIKYKTDDGQWAEVEVLEPYTLFPGARNTVRFKPVTTTSLRLELRQPEQYSCGIYEWEVL